MPIVKQSWVKTPEALEKYLTNDRDAETVQSVSTGLDEGMAKQIRDEHHTKGTNAKNLALTIIQSWKKEESDLFPPEKYNEMGKELAQRIAPGHLAWVYTHTEKNHIHNHIVICSVNSETGKLLMNKRSELKKLHEANNAIARENGFSVIEPRMDSPNTKLPQNVRSMVNRGKESWFFDLSQKADFARAASTSFDEFVGTMKGLGVDVRVEDKNISYLYGDHTKAVRGKRLGKKFNKDSLIMAFRENDERFAKHPGLRDQLHGDIRTAFDREGNSLGTPSDLLLKSTSHPGLGKKDYNQFTKIDRRSTRDELPAIFDERGGILYQEMMKARKVSLFDYCKENKIGLLQNAKGETVLRGKEFIVFKSESEWKNTKSGASGTIIDFVAIHHETTFLHAVSKLTNNPKLMLLEPVMGEYRRGFQSFYFPKPKAAPAPHATEILNRFLSAKGIRGEAAKTFLGNKYVHIGVDKSVWLIGDKGESAREFKEDSAGQWKQKQHGKAFGAFVEATSKSKQLMVFGNPFDFAQSKTKSAATFKGGANILVFFGDEGYHRKLDEFLALNPHISEVHLAHSGKPEMQERDQALFHDLKKRFNPFDIHVKELNLADHGKERSRGPDISL